MTDPSEWRAMRSTRVIIVNYRTAELVIDCLRTLDPEVRSEADCRVVVVDNASGDGSVEKLRAAIAAENWTWAEVLSLEINGGFAAGNNAAFRPLLKSSTPPDYFHLLNPDTYIHPGAVTRLIDYLEAHSAVGIVGSRLENPDGTPQSSAFRFHGVLSEFERGLRLGLATRLLCRWMVAPPTRGETHPTDWVNGASMMIRREVLESIGLFDEGFFLYFEETDFCQRAKRAGWPSWFVPESRVVHLEGRSTGVTGAERARKRLPAYYLASRRRYFRKHHGAGYEFSANLAHLIAYSFWRARKWLQRKPNQDPPHYLRDMFLHTFWLK